MPTFTITLEWWLVNLTIWKFKSSEEDHEMIEKLTNWKGIRYTIHIMLMQLALVLEQVRIKEENA